MKCIYFNARSIVNKLPEWYHLIYSGGYDIITVTESWLNNNIPASLLDPESHFDVIRCYRDSSRGGSVCCLVRKSLKCNEVPLHEQFRSQEVCCFDVNFGAYKFRFFSMYYRPTDNRVRAQAINLITTYLARYWLPDGANIIVGDINCSAINWTNLTAPGDGVQNSFLNFIVQYGY